MPAITGFLVPKVAGMARSYSEGRIPDEFEKSLSHHEIKDKKFLITISYLCGLCALRG